MVFMTSTRRPALRGLALAALVGLATPALSACTSDDAPPSTSTAAASSSTATDSPDDATPTATAPALVSTPVDLDCSTLIDPAALTTLHPGLAPAPVPEAPDGDDDGVITPLERVAAADGTLCAWTDAAGDTITLGVAQYDDAGLTSLANDLVATSNWVPTYGVEGYFEVTQGVGRAEFLPLPYDVVLESTAFVEPGSAEPLASQVVAALEAGGATG
jgi:hypothetical protein